MRKPKRALVRPRDLTDQHVEALREFNQLGLFPDKKLPGLFVFVGARKVVWRYQERRMVKGVRRLTFKTIGPWPKMDTAAARKQATIVAGLTAEKRGQDPLPEPTKFDVAFAGYLEYLKAKALKNGKPPRWHDNAKKLGDNIILPEFASWTLPELAKSPAAVAAFHVRVTKRNGPVSANHCARLIRAAYKRAARLDITLSQERLPTSAVDFNEEDASQAALDFKAFPTWLTAWRKIDNATDAAYHMVGLLTGARPGELNRRHWRDYKEDERNLIIGKAKAGKDIVIAVSDEIVALLAMAREDAKQLGRNAEPDALIFPGNHRNDLPARGNMLRHTYRTVAADFGVDDLLIHFLLGHAPKGISQRYIATLILANGPKMREEQGRMSKRMLELLKLDGKGFQKAIRESLARSRSAGVVKAKAAAEQLSEAQKASAMARRGRRLGRRGPYKARRSTAF